MEAPPMATRAPMRRCPLCGIVPEPPAWNAQAEEWSVSCPCCGASATGLSEDLAREAWAARTEPAEPTPEDADRTLALLDSIEAAMCDMEGIRQIPGAMTAWHRWMDAYRELRMCILEARGARQ